MNVGLHVHIISHNLSGCLYKRNQTFVFPFDMTCFYCFSCIEGLNEKKKRLGKIKYAHTLGSKSITGEINVHSLKAGWSLTTGLVLVHTRNIKDRQNSQTANTDATYILQPLYHAPLLCLRK